MLLTFLIVVAVVVAAVVVWRRRVPLLAKLLGQPESRVDRQLNRRRE
ncbi:hypothetical protein [Nocardioides sp.]|nr:hypothetical protein [Nocardioides sp.]MBJ7358279.1 hypothetical protein [Nocardioides sp.]